MLHSLIKKFRLDVEVPRSVESIRTSVKEMRDAFEHIDDRAQGTVGQSKRVDRDALSIFDQPEFLESGVLTYREYTLDFENDVLSALLDGREALMQAVDARTKQRTEAGLREDAR